MAIDVSEIEIYRDGGSLEFRISGSAVDGFYRLQTPALGMPEPLFKDGQRLELGSLEELGVLAALQEWLATVSANDVVDAMAELDKKKSWLNLADNLSEVVPIYYIRSVVQRLSQRFT